MKPVSPALENLLSRSRIYAALHDHFDPADAVIWANDNTLPTDTQTIARLFAMLRPDCTRQAATAANPALWSLRPATRRWVLGELDADTLQTLDCDTAICDALTGKGAYAPQALDALLESTDITGKLPEIVGTLDRAGPGAVGHDRLVALRGHLNRLRAENRTDKILGDGFVGRDDELSRLAEWIAQPPATPPLQALYISGIAGIGKSFLLEQTIQNARKKHNPLFVRLDFDRSGLNVLDPESFIDEISRQVGDGLPEVAQKLRGLRLKTAEKDAPQTCTAAPMPQGSLIDALARVVRASGRPLVIILDTLEVLRSTGETRIEALFENLDLLAHAGITRIAIIAAGRGNALEPAPQRIAGDVIRLTGLSDAAARLFLQSRDVPAQHWPKVLTLARGNPLFLLLAAKASQDAAFEHTEVPKDASDAAIGGYLYRAIVSRLPDPLRRVASEALLLNRLTPETLEHIIVPVVSPGLAKSEQAKALDLLRKQHWLVINDPVSHAILHRAEVRRAFLPMIYQADPDRADKINARAADWFTGRDRFQSLYHALQGVRAGQDIPDVPGDLALGFDEFMLEELPAGARDAVRHAQGRRSDFGRAGDAITQMKPAAAPPGPAPQTAPQMASGQAGWLEYAPHRKARIQTVAAPALTHQTPDQRAVDDLEILLKTGDLREATFVMENAVKGAFPADGRLGQLVLCYFWLTGRWSTAQRLLRRQPKDALHRAVHSHPLLQGRVLLEMQAEFHFDALVRQLQASDFRAAALTAHHASARIGLRGAALDFALLCALGDAPIPPSLHIAQGIMAHNGIDDWPAAERVSYLARARRAKMIPGPVAASAPRPHRPAPHETLQALAILNPYAAPIQAFLARNKGGALAEFAQNLHQLPGTAAQLFTPHPAPPAGRYLGPADAANSFTALGLCAEWASGFCLFNPIAELPGLARAAERWRRLTGGEWLFGRTPPAGFEAHKPPDKITLMRADALLLTPDPIAAAKQQLLMWSAPTHSPAQAAQHLIRRFEARLAKVAALPPEDAPKAALRHAVRRLIQADVPPLIAPALAILALHRTTLHSTLTQ